MSGSEAMTGARGQIVWIAALVISTAVILQLERLEVGRPAAASRPLVSQQADPAQAAKAAGLLVGAEARLAASPDDADAAAAVLLALSVAMQAGAIDASAGGARVTAVLERAAKASPDWQPLMVWAAMTFSNVSPAEN